MRCGGLPDGGPPDGLWVKPESLQPTGAFKLRGAGNAIAALPEPVRARGVVAHSSGNHAQAVGYAARAFGVSATIVIPEDAPQVKVDATAATGATVVRCAPTMAARVESARAAADRTAGTIIAPFDDPVVIAGQGTVGLEIAVDAPDADVVLVPISGGGLIAGIAAVLHARRPRMRVIGVQPELNAHARESFTTGRRVGWDPRRSHRTIADGLRVERLGELPFEHLRAQVDDVVTVTEEEIRGALRVLATDARLVAEPSGAVACAAYLYRRPELPAGRRYVAVLSGGNIDPRRYAELLAGR